MSNQNNFDSIKMFDSTTIFIVESVYVEQIYSINKKKTEGFVHPKPVKA